MNFFRITNSVVAGVAMAACAHAAPQASTSPTQATASRAGNPDTVALHFHWPDGTRMRITEHSVADGDAGKFELKSSRQLDVLSKGDSLIIVPSNSKAELVQGLGDGGDSEDFMKRLMPQIMARAIPTLVVTNEGKVRDAQLDGQALGKLFIEELAPTLKDAKERELFELLVVGVVTGATTEAIAQAKRDFADNFGIWNGRELVQGRPIEIAGKYDGMPTGDVALVQALSFEGYAPCHVGAPERSCVRLKVQSRLADPKPQEEGISIPAFSMTRELLAEPTTLLPHAARLEVAFELAMVADGESARVAQRVTLAQTYTHEAK